MYITDSLFKARKMVKKGLNNIDISSTDDDILLKPKQRTAKTVSNLQFSSSCPTFSGVTSNKNIKMSYNQIFILFITIINIQ